jgi:hypothetical protein
MCFVAGMIHMHVVLRSTSDYDYDYVWCKQMLLTSSLSCVGFSLLALLMNHVRAIFSLLRLPSRLPLDK